MFGMVDPAGSAGSVAPSAGRLIVGLQGRGESPIVPSRSGVPDAVADCD